MYSGVTFYLHKMLKKNPFFLCQKKRILFVTFIEDKI